MNTFTHDHQCLLLLALGLTARTSPLDKRQTCVDTCGSVCYWQSDIDDAVNQGCYYYRNGQTVGSNRYPHTFNNFEGFSFPSSGPYQEFPILRTYQPYTGGNPGPDRVIFNSNCDFEQTVTHTGAGGNNFVTC